VKPSTMKPGQTVKYSHPQPGEESFRFTLLEDNGNRVLIQLQCTMPIKPVECVAKEDVCAC